MKHSASCKFNAGNLEDWYRGPDPSCPRCHYKLETGRWPKVAK